MKNKLTISLLLFFQLTIFSCSAGDKPGISDQESLHGRDWVLKSLNNEKIFTPEASKDIFIRFDSGQNRFSGFAGCNNIFGTYTLIKDKIKFGPVAGTEMYCESRMETEKNFMKMFEVVSRISVKNNELNFYDGNGNITAVFKALNIKQ